MPERSQPTPPSRNRSPYGWWIASYLLRFEFDDEDPQDERRRCLAWENTIVLKAKDRDQAYEKAVRVGRRENGEKGWDGAGRRGRWRFEGLTSLLPIYQEINDGAEVLWREFRNVAVKTVRARVKSKRALEVFEDTAAPGDLIGADNSLRPTRTAGRAAVRPRSMSRQDV